MRKMALLAMLLLAASTVEAALQVQEVIETGGGIQYTDHYYIVTDPGYWEAMVDAESGAIFSFKDLTDNGVQVTGKPPYNVGDHVNYLGTATNGTDMCYHIQSTMLYLDGKSLSPGDTLFTKNNPVLGVANRLSFSWDADKFTITYTEDENSTDFLYDNQAYTTTDPAPTGSLRTTATLELNAATETGTIFKLSHSQTVYTTAGVDCRLYASGAGATHYIHNSYPGYSYSITTTYDEQESAVDGAWNPADPKSFGRRTVTDAQGNLDIGLTVGRTFILDHVYGHVDGMTYGTAFTPGTWANGQRVVKNHPFRYSPRLPNGYTKTEIVDLRINIAAVASPDPDVNTSSVDATTPHLANGTDASTVTITLRNVSGNPVVGWPASRVRIYADPSTGLTITQPTTDTDANGQTTGTIVCDQANPGNKTVTARLDLNSNSIFEESEAITDDATVRFFSLNPELFYAYGAQNEMYRRRELIITAKKAGVDIWEMKLWVPMAGYVDTTHQYFAPGQIISFKDLQNDSSPASFNYSGEAQGNETPGLMEWAGNSRWDLSLIHI